MSYFAMGLGVGLGGTSVTIIGTAPMIYVTTDTNEVLYQSEETIALFSVEEDAILSQIETVTVEIDEDGEEVITECQC